MKIKFKHQIEALTSLILITVSLFIVLFFLDFHEAFLTVFSIAFFVQLIPTLYLHLEYYIENRNSIYEISNNELSIQKNLDRRVINKSEIEKIVVYMAPSVYQGSKLHLLPIEGYYYGAIYLKSGEQIIMTCLLTPEIEDILRQLSGVPLFRKKRLFNTLKWKD